MSTTTTAPTFRARQPRLTAFVVGLALGIASTAIVLVALALLGLDTPADGKCPAGSFPATDVHVGGDCFADGTTLPTGWTADPGGNEGLDVPSR